MSWAVVSFAAVLAVLASGWLAYERSRPTARTIAVVATLAALAALGRDAFAALPEVKPITAMTLVVGYALGPLPGFAVGAIGMLASNLMLGEGLYTPWQMTAWGLVGLAGAALGALSGRRLGRTGIALASAAAALGAKEVMNVYEWTISGAHTAAAFLLIAGRGAPFDATDAAASFLFGLAFGPELARMLLRLRARTTIAWEEPAAPAVALAAVCTAAALLSALPAPARATPAGSAAARVAATRAVRFLEGAQNSDGGFGGSPGQRSSEMYSAWAALGLASAGEDPSVLERDGQSLPDALGREAPTLRGAADIERTILALSACGAPATLARHGDLVAALLRMRAADGSFGPDLVNVTSFAVLALRAAGRASSDPVVEGAVTWLERRQSHDGGFGYAAGGAAPDVDDTAAALQALAGSPATPAPPAGAPAHPEAQAPSAARRALGYLLRAANGDGGFPQQPGMPSNAQSTAWAVQALLAAGRSPNAPVAGAARSPLAYLEGLQEHDGSVRYSAGSAQTPVWVSAQALMAFTERPLPVAAPPVGRLDRLARQAGRLIAIAAGALLGPRAR